MRALVTGALGQDGHYLTAQLAAAGVKTYGMTRRPHPDPPGVRLIHGDLLDQSSLEAVLREVRPDRVYHLAAVTSPGCGWGCPQPPLLAETTGVGTVRLLEAMVRCASDARLVNASSSAIYDPHRYGLYGVAKVFAHEAVIGYRARLHASNAVLYSHTSPRQDHRFLAATICSTLARIAYGSPERLVLTDLAGDRDWSHAADIVRALPLIADRDAPGDHDVASGEIHSVADFVGVALGVVGLDWDRAVELRPGPQTPPERPPALPGVRTLGWKPAVPFADLVESLMHAAIAPLPTL